jgi:thiamine-phosphate pyrophosphorylase
MGRTARAHVNLLVLTDRSLVPPGRSLVDVVRAAVEGGATQVVLREKDLPRVERVALAGELRTFVPVLLVASDASVGADGVHLAAADSFPIDRPRVVGRSCHSRADLEQAAREGCDYATLSPIFESPSKPGYGPALGLDALPGAPLPVYALGGVDPANARSCLDAGAAGVAVMGYVMRADDPAVAVKELLS